MMEEGLATIPEEGTPILTSLPRRGAPARQGRTVVVAVLAALAFVAAVAGASAITHSSRLSAATFYSSAIDDDVQNDGLDDGGCDITNQTPPKCKDDDVAPVDTDDDLWGDDKALSDDQR